MTRADEFIELYRELELVAAEQYNLPKDGSVVLHLSNRREFRSIKPELDYCRDVRNLLSHNPKIGHTYVVEPSEQMVQLLRATLAKVKNPPKATDIMIPMQKILWKTEKDFVLPVLKDMIEHTYTHIPILENGVVIGVLSESTILSYLVDEEIIEINNSMRFSDLRNYLKMENHKSESFRFVSKDTLKAKLDELFSNALESGDRIGMVFVTHSGKKTEKILGIITAWDLAGAN